MNLHFHIEVWKTIHEEDETCTWECGGRQRKDGICIHMDENINNLHPTGTWQEGRPETEAWLREELAMYWSTLAKGEVASAQGCTGVGVRCERACPT